MKRKFLEKATFVLILSLLFVGCVKKESTNVETTILENFESGSIGLVNKISNVEWEIHLADDNDNASLPDRWRNWWYIKLENASTQDPIMLTLKNRGWPYYYLPVYSYNQVDWIRFTEEEVLQNANKELIINKKFDRKDVWIARFYPYTYTNLKNYITTIENSPYITIQTPGVSQQGKPIYVFKITDSSIPVTNKKRVFIHARTHPAETSPSFLLEGFINFLLSGNSKATQILSEIEFHIFPMQNVDGVIAGNYRSTPLSENLEVLWDYNTVNPIDLNSTVPVEVALVHNYAKSLMTNGGPPVSIALNLHASNSEPTIRPFFFPHFGPESLGYSKTEASLWKKHVGFISLLTNRFGSDKIEPIPQQGGRGFTNHKFPETWWWTNFQNNVMAITMEMTYGKWGYTSKWVDINDMKDLGISLALSIQDYSNRTFDRLPQFIGPRNRDLNLLRYPLLYPPLAEYELKN